MVILIISAFLGGTIIGPTFNGYAPFPNPAAVLPPRGHPAFFPQQIIYWPYPSPPVSPTAYYGPAHPPPHPHIAPNFTPPLHQPTLLPFDYGNPQISQQTIHTLPQRPSSIPPLQPIVNATQQSNKQNGNFVPLSQSVAVQNNSPTVYSRTNGVNHEVNDHDRLLSPRILTPVSSTESTVVASPNHHYVEFLIV